MAVNYGIRTGKFDASEKNPSVITDDDLTTFHQITFDVPFHPDAEVIVFLQTQSFHGWNSPGVRIADVTTEGFKYRMNELTAAVTGALSDGVHNVETFGYIAYGM